MLLCRLIAPSWLTTEKPDTQKVLEGEFTIDDITNYNSYGYNVYYLPNYPSIYEGGSVKGYQIDTFEYVFVDMDLKDGSYPDKETFIQAVQAFPKVPSLIVDSGNGVHVYWRVNDLDPKSYLKLQRRLMRRFKTDEAVGQIFQLMRLPGTNNTKVKGEYKTCEILFESNSIYNCEDMDGVLPIITRDDEQYCDQHYNKTYNLATKEVVIEEKLPLKFSQLLATNGEVKDLWIGENDDRSKADFRLGHIMFASGFTKEEATSVLVNSAKALERAPIHRLSYAQNITDKIWTFEILEDKSSLNLSKSVADILSKGEASVKGIRFACWKYFDSTVAGFKLGQVIGLVAGSGVGKTAVCLDMFEGFATNNPSYEHFFIPLEQPEREIADRLRTRFAGKLHMLEKMHIISNYDDEGNFRHLSLAQIEEYIVNYQRITGKKVGCIAIDHIGALAKVGTNGESQGLMDICHSMKAFAHRTNTMLIMQSQAPREKAGIGDLELNKDAAYGTVYFEAYCDYLITLWQPLKRCYKAGAPTVMAYKFCKIRHKKQGYDNIQEDVCYRLMFDVSTEKLRDLTDVEEKAFKFFLQQATNKRKEDRKTDLVQYDSVKWSENGTQPNIDKKTTGTTTTEGVH